MNGKTIYRRPIKSGTSSCDDSLRQNAGSTASIRAMGSLPTWHLADFIKKIFACSNAGDVQHNFLPDFITRLLLLYIRPLHELQKFSVTKTQ